MREGSFPLGRAIYHPEERDMYLGSGSSAAVGYSQVLAAHDKCNVCTRHALGVHVAFHGAAQARRRDTHGTICTEMLRSMLEMGSVSSSPWSEVVRLALNVITHAHMPDESIKRRHRHPLITNPSPTRASFHIPALKAQVSCGLVSAVNAHALPCVPVAQFVSGLHWVNAPT